MTFWAKRSLKFMLWNLKLGQLHSGKRRGESISKSQLLQEEKKKVKDDYY
jgi:hypothetical protein